LKKKTQQGEGVEKQDGRAVTASVLANYTRYDHVVRENRMQLGGSVKKGKKPSNEQKREGDTKASEKRRRGTVLLQDDLFFR